MTRFIESIHLGERREPIRTEGRVAFLSLDVRNVITSRLNPFMETTFSI